MEDFFNFVPDNYFLIVIVVVLSGFLRGFIGFGSGLLMIPILSYFYSPVFAMVFNIVIEIPATIYLTFVGVKKSNLKGDNSYDDNNDVNYPFWNEFF